MSAHRSRIYLGRYNFNRITSKKYPKFNEPLESENAAALFSKDIGDSGRVRSVETCFTGLCLLGVEEMDFWRRAEKEKFIYDKIILQIK